VLPASFILHPLSGIRHPLSTSFGKLCSKPIDQNFQTKSDSCLSSLLVFAIVNLPSSCACPFYLFLSSDFVFLFFSMPCFFLLFLFLILGLCIWDLQFLATFVAARDSIELSVDRQRAMMDGQPTEPTTDQFAICSYSQQEFLNT